MSVTHGPSLSDRTLGDLVAEASGRARVLERHGIDYCCHGDRTLGSACEEAGLDTGALATELAAVEASGAVAPAAGGPLALTEHIVSTHHAYLDDELPAIDALATKVRDVHGARHPELVRVAEIVTALRADLEPHLRQEERVVFPDVARVVLGGTADDLRAEVAALVAEHQEVGDVLRELRSLTGGFAAPADGCASYHALYERLEALERDTFEHIHLENNVLFPEVLARLS